jgi:2'-5' RNA ligase
LRLFVAFGIPEHVRREVRRRSAGLKERLPRARWIDPELLHLNLLFVGAVDDEATAKLGPALAQAVAGFAPIELRLVGAGGFPPHRPARVAWVGVEAPPELAALQMAIAQTAHASINLALEERPYRPHVTLARCPVPWQRRALDQLEAAFAGATGPPFIADQVALIESSLSPRGARHREVTAYPLLGTVARAGALS